MAYNLKNQLTRMRSGGKEIAYRYDPCGNLVEKQLGGLSDLYKYDDAGMLREFTGHDGFAQQYQYDAMGMRVRKQERGDRERQTLEALLHETVAPSAKTTGEVWRTTEYLQDITLPYGQVLAETTGDAHTCYTYGLERLSAVSGDSYTHYQYDGRGSVAQALTRGGTQSFTYSPFGEMLGGKQTGFGYNAEDYDAATGMLHLRMRQYEPGMGRFSQKDFLKGDVSDALSLNRYSFVLNNPVDFIDPSGLDPMSVRKGDQYGLFVSSQGMNVTQTALGLIPGFTPVNSIGQRLAGFRKIDVDYWAISGTIANVADVAAKTYWFGVANTVVESTAIVYDWLGPQTYKVNEAISNHFSYTVWLSDTRNLVDKKFTYAFSNLSLLVATEKLEVRKAVDVFGQDAFSEWGSLGMITYQFDPLTGEKKLFSQDAYYFFKLDCSMDGKLTDFERTIRNHR